MLTRRRITQEAHERFNVAKFLQELNRRHRSSYRVIAEPNPPEAIIESKRKTSWIEVTSVFMSRTFAKETWTYATSRETPRPMLDELIIAPDAHFAEQFFSTVKKKLEKRSYEALRDKYGPGYLVVSVQYPLFGDDTLVFMRKAWNSATIEDRACFRSIYLVIPRHRGYQVVLWRARSGDA